MELDTLAAGLADPLAMTLDTPLGLGSEAAAEVLLMVAATWS
jgi:hypothetical protein